MGILDFWILGSFAVLVLLFDTHDASENEPKSDQQKEGVAIDFGGVAFDYGGSMGDLINLMWGFGKWKGRVCGCCCWRPPLDGRSAEPGQQEVKCLDGSR